MLEEFQVSEHGVHVFCDIPNYLNSIQDTSYADSVEGTFCLHINKLFFRLLSWLGKNDTNVLNSSGTSKVGCHRDLTLPFLFQNETPFVVGFLRILAPKMTDTKELLSLFSSYVSHQLLLSAMLLCLYTSTLCPTDLTTYPQSPRLLPVPALLVTRIVFPQTWSLRVIPFLHVPVNGNFALISSGYGTTPVPGCKDSSELCSCIEIPCTLNPGQRKREMPILSKPMLILRIFPGYLYSASLPFFSPLFFKKKGKHFHLSSITISITSDT